MSIKRSFSTRKRAGTYLSPGQKKNKTISNVLLILAGVLSAAGIVFIFVFGQSYRGGSGTGQEVAASVISDETGAEEKSSYDRSLVEAERKARQDAFEAYVLSIEPDFEFAHFKGEPTLTETGDAVLDEANRLAAGYDYDAAAQKIKTVIGYGNIPEYKAALQGYYEAKASLRQWEINNNITHIFFHSLVVNPGITFNKAVTGFKLEDYNSAMTTVSEFVSIIESMYEKGYVLVDIYDVCRMEMQPDGTEKMRYQKLMLPEGKTPFILSIDDTNYYEYMTGQGFALHLIVDGNGRVQNDYRLTNGEIITGSFDVIPILEDFIDMHPDFSYKGGRGMAGITGYNGVLGYRTSDFWYTKDCPYYISNETNNKYFAEEITSGYNEQIEADKKTAREVADAIKAMNWHFASHTWGHKRLGEVALGTINWDSDMWKLEVEPILGETDLLIFPYGNDIGQGVGWKTYEYAGINERYRILKGYGFNYFFNVDSAVYFMQRTDGYFRQGRRNLDGDRIWEAVYADRELPNWKNRTSDLFDAQSVIDPLRPELQAYLKKLK